MERRGSKNKTARDEEEEESEEEKKIGGIQQPTSITCNEEGIVSNKPFSFRTDSIVISFIGVRSGVVDGKWIRCSS
jgi:hypothetical protein